MTDNVFEESELSVVDKDKNSILCQVNLMLNKFMDVFYNHEFEITGKGKFGSFTCCKHPVMLYTCKRQMFNLFNTCYFCIFFCYWIIIWCM